MDQASVEEARGGFGDPNLGNQAAEAACLEGATRKSDEIDLVAGLVVLDERLVGLPDPVIDADPDPAFHELQRLAVGRDDAFDVMRDLLHAIAVGGGNDLMQLADVCEDRTCPVVVPRAVQAQNDSLHTNPQTTSMGRSRRLSAAAVYLRRGTLWLSAIATVTARMKIGCQLSVSRAARRAPFFARPPAAGAHYRARSAPGSMGDAVAASHLCRHTAKITRLSRLCARRLSVSALNLDAVLFRVALEPRAQAAFAFADGLRQPALRPARPVPAGGPVSLPNCP